MQKIPFTYRYADSISGAYDQRIGVAETFQLSQNVMIFAIKSVILNSHVYCDQYNGVPINFNSNGYIDLSAIGRAEYDSICYAAGTNYVKGSTHYVFGEGQTFYENVIINVMDRSGIGSMHLDWNVMPAFGVNSTDAFVYHIGNPVKHFCDYVILIEGWYSNVR